MTTKRSLGMWCIGLCRRPVVATAGEGERCKGVKVDGDDDGGDYAMQKTTGDADGGGGGGGEAEIERSLVHFFGVEFVFSKLIPTLKSVSVVYVCRVVLFCDD